MPYINRARRERLDEIFVGDVRPDSPGELNYILTRICLNAIEEYGDSYATFNTIIGALEACKLELYRRTVAGYEDGKIAVNGDIYPQGGRSDA